MAGLCPSNQLRRNTSPSTNVVALGPLAVVGLGRWLRPTGRPAGRNGGCTGRVARPTTLVLVAWYLAVAALAVRLPALGRPTPWHASRPSAGAVGDVRLVGPGHFRRTGVFGEVLEV